MDGEDLMVRRAAVEALGPYNGSVVALDPSTGRILTIVNQKLAYKDSFQPCSTIKIVAAVAGLNEGIIGQSTHFRLTRRRSIDLTEALAHSNNAYFSAVGYKLGYDRIIQYAQMFGLGEKAGLDLDAEQAGELASEAPKDGVGMMTSFGEGIYMTPLELAAVVSTVANGGTLYYLQHPRSLEEIQQFVPRVKRKLDIAQWLPDIRPGMMGAVEYGTARRASYVADETDLRQNRDLHRRPLAHAPGLVRILQRSRRQKAGRRGSADRRTPGERTGGLRRCRRGLQESLASGLFRASDSKSPVALFLPPALRTEP